MSLALLLGLQSWALADPPSHSVSSRSERPTVLVLIPMQPGRPLFDMFARGIVTEFIDGPPATVYVEHLFDVLDPAEVNAQQLRFLRDKYAGRHMDAVIAIGHPRYARVREELGLAATVPIVFLEGTPGIAAVANSTRVRMRDSVAASYEFVRQLRPGPHHVALIGGASSADRQLNEPTLARLAALVARDRLIDLTGLTLEETRARVRGLPNDTFLLVGDVLADRAGRPLSQLTLMSAIAPVARVPIVVANDMLLGYGALGGRLYELQPLGARLAQVARRLIAGTPAASIPDEDVHVVSVLDARQLRRFGIDESRVPAGTVLRYREATLWEKYRAWFVAGGVLLLLQAGLIAGLLAARRSRRASQQQLATRRRLQALVADISTAFANSTANRVEMEMVERLEHVGRALEAEDCALWTWRSPDDAPRLLCRWITRAGALPVTSVEDDALLAWARPRLELGETVPVDTPGPSTLLLPLRVDARVVGVFLLRHGHSRTWPEYVLGDLRTIGEIIASAIVRQRADASIRSQLETLAHVNRVAGLGELAASIAHELNQPLAAILANTEVAIHLLGGPDPPLEEIRAIVDDVIADDERAGGIIRNMRAMLRKHPIEALPVDVNAVVVDVMRLVQHDPRLRGSTLDLTLAHDLPTATIDATQLKQVLLNLVVNAVDAMAPGAAPSVIRVLTTHRDGGALIEVVDQGPGIPELLLPRLFEPFFTTKPDGLGVGLAISRSILEAVGGRITADNAPGGGAIFRVWLPASATTTSIPLPQTVGAAP